MLRFPVNIDQHTWKSQAQGCGHIPGGEAAPVLLKVLPGPFTGRFQSQQPAREAFLPPPSPRSQARKDASSHSVSKSYQS